MSVYDSYCPICNGLEWLAVACPNGCGQATDAGRFNDLLGPYSPYRPIEDISMTNGFRDLEERKCIHVVHCSQCDHSFYVEIKEWDARNMQD